MGLFDSLPPAKQAGPTSARALGKRDAAAAAGTSEGSAKKARQQEGDAPPAAAAAGGGSDAAPCHVWTGSLQAAYSEDMGSRLTMEDVAVVQLEAAPPSAAACRLAYCAVFDGHGGAAVARHAAAHLHDRVLAAGLQREAERLAAAAATAGGAADAPPPAAQIKVCKSAVAEGFRELDREVLELCAAQGWPDGCTAVAAWVVGDAAVVANVGDARCVLARRPLAPDAREPADGADQPEHGAGPQGGQPPGAAPGPQPQQAQSLQSQQQPQQAGQLPLEPLKAVTLTREHKAIFPAERRRIEAAGSFVSGDGRLAGRIEVSRAFGDRQFKRQGMSAAPDVQAFQLSPREAFLLLACDGFWGVFSPQDAVDFAHRELVLRRCDPKQACNRLLHEAVRERRCRDNCTVLLLLLDGQLAEGGGA